jgi:hypothetical protein
MILFDRMSSLIKERVVRHEPGLYLALVFPIAFAFTLTFAVARLISHVDPMLFFEPTPGLHIHHFTYGFFILAIAGYLALIFNGPDAKFWIALLFGLGLGLAMDEFGMWLRLRDDDLARWSYDGLNIVIGFFFLLAAFKQGVRLLRALWPF